MSPFRSTAILIALAVAVLGPFVLAAASPLQAYRSPAYVAGSLAGVLALALLLVQPLLAAGYLPILRGPYSRRWHSRLGSLLVVAVAVHIGGLFVESPDDAVSALTLQAPTAFSLYGVTAMWCIILSAALVALRRRLPIHPTTWRTIHNVLAVVVVVATTVHAVQIEGALGPWSKVLLGALVVGATVFAMTDLRILRPRKRAR